jgi:hypothetical protein
MAGAQFEISIDGVPRTSRGSACASVSARAACPKMSGNSACRKANCDIIYLLNNVGIHRISQVRNKPSQHDPQCYHVASAEVSKGTVRITRVSKPRIVGTLLG